MKIPPHTNSLASGAKPASRLVLALASIGLQAALSPAIAQQVNPSLDAGQLLKQEQINRIPSVPATGDEPSLDLQARPLQQLPGSDQGPKVLVNSIRFVGAASQPESVLVDLISPQLSQELGFSDIQNLANLVAQFYRKQGYFLAQVLVPPQDISGGQLVLKVIEGRLSQKASRTTVQGLERSEAGRISNTLLAPLDPETGLKEQDLERGILVLNDLPGIKASVIVEPGEEPETARLFATVRESGLLRGSFSMDNAGNRYTGAFRAGLNVSADNLTGEGDQVLLQTSKAVHGDFSYGRLAYNRPIGYSGLIAGISASTVDYTSGKELASLDAKGKAEAVVLNAQYPLIRSRPANLYLNSSLEQRVVTSQTLGVPVTNKRFDVLSLGLTGDRADALLGGGVNSASFSFTQGRLDLDRLPGTLQADQGPGGQKTNGDYSRLNFNFTRLQSITKATVAQATFSGQYASQNLDSGEKFGLGGPLGVKAYPAGEALGDRGLLLNLETRSVLAKGLRLGGVNVGDVQFSFFHDIGRIRQFDEAPNSLGTPETYLLRDIGLGFNIGNAGRYDLRIYLARALGDNPGADLNGNDSNGRNSKARLVIFSTIYF